MNQKPWQRALVAAAMMLTLGAAAWLVTWASPPGGNYRSIGHDGLQVTDEWSARLFRQLQARYGSRCLLDLRTSAEQQFQPDLDESLLALQEDGALPVRRMPLRPDEVPARQAVAEFLSICQNPTAAPIIVYAPPVIDEQPEIRSATLETAYRCLVDGQSLDQAIKDARLSHSRHEPQVRQLVGQLAADSSAQ